MWSSPTKTAHALKRHHQWVDGPVTVPAAHRGGQKQCVGRDTDASVGVSNDPRASRVIHLIIPR